MIISSNVRFLFVLAAHYFPPEKELRSKVENLDATEDWKACAESYKATNQTQHVFRGQLATTSFRRKLSICHLQILFHLVKGWGFKVDVHYLELQILLCSWKKTQLKLKSNNQPTVIFSCPGRVAVLQIQSPEFFVFLILRPNRHQFLIIALRSLLIHYLPGKDKYRYIHVIIWRNKLPLCDIGIYSMACNFTVRGEFSRIQSMPAREQIW